MKLLKELAAFVKEREAIHQRRLAGEEPPWTRDPILTTYRFCNVRREDDRVTRWIHSRWLLPHRRDLGACVFAMTVARLVNWIPSLEAIGWPVPWEVKRFTTVLDELRDSGAKAFTSAYMIHADAHATGTKAAYLGERVLTPVWEGREELAAGLERDRMLRKLHMALTEYRDLGSFMAGQIVADVKWTPVGQLALDWTSFAAPGPGSRRGMSWVSFGHPDYRWLEEEWQEALGELRARILPKLPPELRNLDNQNLQNCLCEFSKYMKVRSGLGRPKQYFTPSKEPYVQF